MPKSSTNSCNKHSYSSLPIDSAGAETFISTNVIFDFASSLIAASNNWSVPASPDNQDLTMPIRKGWVDSAAATNPLIPERTSSKRAASATLRASGPGESWASLIGITPTRDTDPTVGFIPTQPFKEAGQTIEPSVSVPTARETKPAEIAEPEPDEDPPALCL